VSVKPKRQDEPSSALDSVDPPRNFTLGVDERIRALTIGAPAYAIRKRKIEDTEAKWVDTLVELRDKLVAKGTPRVDIEGALREKAATFDYRRLNELVALHNRWYPVEANLPMDLRGRYLVYGRVWHPETELTPERILARVS
jgi:hypothetical protein